MKSRYDFFDESNVVDEDGINFPDPLSVDYNEGELTKIPIEHRVSAKDLAKFWITMYEQYGISYYDDILLNENNIPYLMCLKPGDIMYFPKPEDLSGFITSAISNDAS